MTLADLKEYIDALVADGFERAEVLIAAYPFKQVKLPAITCGVAVDKSSVTLSARIDP